MPLEAIGNEGELDAIAASIMEDVSPAGGNEKPVASQDDDQREDDAVEGDQDADQEEAEEETEDEKEEKEEFLDVTDDDMLEVKIDGEVTYKSVKEAKEALSSLGAISNRLQEVSQKQQEVEEFRANSVKEMETMRTKFLATVNQFAGQLLAPRVSPPDAKLATTNPAQYIAQDALYKQDQNRIAEMRGKLQNDLAAQQQEQRGNMQALIDAEERKLIQREPEFGDRAKAAAHMASIVEAAKYYGFTEEEIASTSDHRVFLMALDAARARSLKSAKPKDADALKKDVETSKAIKKLRSGVADRQRLANQTARLRKSVRDRAAKSGSVDDIADFISEPAARRRN